MKKSNFPITCEVYFALVSGANLRHSEVRSGSPGEHGAFTVCCTKF